MKGDPLAHQVGGGHYKHYKIQPIEYITANNLPFIEGCVVKYISRWRDKGGVEDLEKVKHYVDLLIAAEKKRVLPDIDYSSIVPQKTSGSWMDEIFEKQLTRHLIKAGFGE